VRHLSTDRFVTTAELDSLLRAAGLNAVTHRYWTFVPRGDVPAGVGPILTALDWCARPTGWGCPRGGIAVAATPSA